ncbi:hypothetical protein H6G93_07695 [Nostoc sp. FACHB-973]|nr:hypothetical protein [Nostoc sp. FACHB-973]
MIKRDAINRRLYKVATKFVGWVEERNPTLLSMLGFALLNPTYVYI